MTTEADKNAQLAKLVGMHTDMEAAIVAFDATYSQGMADLRKQHVDAIKAEAAIYLGMGVDPANLNPILVSLLS